MAGDCVRIQIERIELAGGISVLLEKIEQSESVQ
jgi:hypothetical protein